MHLSDEEKAMMDGRDGPAVQKAMDLLMRYGEALGAERLVETRNVCATITSTTPFQRDFALAKGGGMDAVFSSSASTARRPSRSRSSRSSRATCSWASTPASPSAWA